MINEDILDCVVKLNTELAEQGFEEGDIEFSVSSNGWVVNVEVLGVCIWSTEDDNRDYNEQTEEYQLLEDYLRREFKALVARINSIQL